MYTTVLLFVGERAKDLSANFWITVIELLFAISSSIPRADTGRIWHRRRV